MPNPSAILRKNEKALSLVTSDKSLFQEFENLLDDFLKKQVNLEGQIVKGIVVSMDRDMALIDVNLKSEGRVPLKEFLPEKINIGDIVDIYIDRYEGAQGDSQLSHERARQEASWQNLAKAYQDQTPVEGVILNQVKGGLTVEIQGTIAFLPGSQVDIRPVKDLSGFIGTTQSFMILKMDESRSNVVVSRRAMLEAMRASEKQELLSTLDQGQILEGVVKNITEYGAFVDLGGIDGLLHVTDMAWRRISHPSEVLTLGQSIKVMVIRFSKETLRISLGLKQLEKDPWTTIKANYVEGQRIKGVVTNITDYGAFVEIEEGLEGLVHVGDMMWCHPNVNPRSVVSTGQSVETIILKIEEEKRRVSLGMKQCHENPLIAFSKENPVGSIVDGSVKDVTDAGLLISLPNHIRGMVHIIDIAWDLKERALDQYYPGQDIKAKVLDIRVDVEMVSLGIKQLNQDVWASQCGDLKRGQSVSCTVESIGDNGIQVSLNDAPEIKVSIPRSELARDRSESNPQRFQIGQILEARVTAFNPDSRHLALSIRAQELRDEQEVLAEYSKSSEGSSLGDLLSKVLDQDSDHS